MGQIEPVGDPVTYLASLPVALDAERKIDALARDDDNSSKRDFAGETLMLHDVAVVIAAAAFAIFGMRASADAAEVQIEELTIADAHRAMSAGQLTARQLVEFYLQRVAAFDKSGPSINAILYINTKALEEADRLDAQFRTGGLVGPLHGIPILLKDAIATKDMPTTGGSESLRGFVPRNDATIVTKLKAAGAIILGKTNLDEFTFGTRGVSSLGGQTLNPYDLARNPAGSSGGSAAAVASNMAMAALGTDTGSSIRFPASANSLVGVRGTVGLVSRAGIMPNSYTQDMGGPITRTIADAAVILGVIVGYDPLDAATAWSTTHIPPSYQDVLRSDGLKGARIGVLGSFFGKDAAAAGVNAVMAEAVETMARSGAVVVQLAEPFDIVSIGEMQVAAHETTHYLDQYLREEQAPHASLASILQSGRIAREVEASIRNRLKLTMKDAQYSERLLQRAELQNRVMKLMADQSLDAIVYPFSQTLVARIGEGQARHNGFLSAVTGFPAVVAPAGFSEPTDTAAIGVPVGIEIIGRPWSEASLLRIAYSFEQASNARRPPVGLQRAQASRN